jgi:MFS family permease
MTAAPAAAESGSPFRIRAFRLLFTARVASHTANQMQAVAIAWQVYDLTGSALHLGLIGLVQFIAPLCLTLVAGQIADQFDRRQVIRCCYVVEIAASSGLVALSLTAAPPLAAFYLLLLVNSMARTFENPGLQALLPALVPRESLGRAVATNSSALRMAQLGGPTLGGFLYAVGPATVYGLCIALILIAAVAMARLTAPARLSSRAKVSWDSLFAGLRFIRATPAVLGAMSLDLVATLFGGATALLPIFARDILEIGPEGFGMLRSAQALGGLAAALLLARYPVRAHGGKVMFAGVAVYGVATILFGVSTNVSLSVALLVLLGFGDMFSTVIRQTLIQVNTPDEVRGRVAGVNMLFVGTATQLGSFEAGLVATFLGPVGAVVLGGSAVLLIVALWTQRFPALRDVGNPARPVLAQEA